MATTKNGKLRKLLKKCLTKKDTQEMENKGRVQRTTVTIINEKGKPEKQESEILVFSRCDGRNSRRKEEIKRLTEALKGGGKKERMKGFAHKKERSVARKAAKMAAKQEKGKKKGN